MIDELNTRLDIPPGYYIHVGPVETTKTLEQPLHSQRVTLYKSSGKWYRSDEEIARDLIFVDGKTWKPDYDFDLSMRDIIEALAKIPPAKLPPVRPGRHA